MRILLLCSFLCICHARIVIVNTTTGLIMGRIIYDDIIDVKYKAFEGIPYAEPPLGDLRFRAPLPKKPWKNILNATAVGFACPQLNIFSLNEGISENCLFLNIFTPINSSINEPMPVLIFVHGGDFRYGSSNPNEIYGPQFILKGNIVVATMNYRLGPLGFLSLEREDALGNTGIKDVLLAVEWIYKNIIFFNGDPSKITIAGHSAGSVIVQCLMLSQKANYLFQKAILLSGSILSYKYYQKNPKANARILGKELGLTWTDDTSLLNKLKNVNYSSIVHAEERIIIRDPRRGIRIYTPFSMCIEQESPGAIITEMPIDSIKSGKMKNMPTIVALTNQEGMELLPSIKEDPSLLNLINDNITLSIPSDITYPPGSEMIQKLASSIRKFYFKGGNVSFSNLQNFTNLITDSEFSYSTDYLVQLLKEQQNSAPLYYFVFTFDGMLNSFKLYENISFPGAAHGDGIGYMFVQADLRLVYDKIDFKTKDVVNILQTYLANFIKYGNPTPHISSNGFWWPDTGKYRYHLILDDHPTVVWHAPIPERTNFWRSVYEEYNQYKNRFQI